jgi:predicted nucleic acid-binding Zn ribbon protein
MISVGRVNELEEMQLGTIVKYNNCNRRLTRQLFRVGFIQKSRQFRVETVSNGNCGVQQNANTCRCCAVGEGHFYITDFRQVKLCLSHAFHQYFSLFHSLHFNRAIHVREQ